MAPDLQKLILQLRHPADEIRISAEIAYWDAGHRTYMLGKIVGEFDKLAAMVAELRAAIGPQAEAA